GRRRRGATACGAALPRPDAGALALPAGRLRPEVGERRRARLAGARRRSAGFRRAPRPCRGNPAPGARMLRADFGKGALKLGGAVLSRATTGRLLPFPRAPAVSP